MTGSSCHSASVMDSSAAYEAITRLADDVRLKGSSAALCFVPHEHRAGPTAGDAPDYLHHLCLPSVAKRHC